ncbi:hypothetical protein SSS_10680, partial [Sarcoptes scabiei]
SEVVPESLDKDETREEFITEVVTDIETGKKKIVKKKKPKQGVDAETPIEQETKAEDQKKPEESKPEISEVVPESLDKDETEEKFITEVILISKLAKRKL